MIISSMSPAALLPSSSTTTPEQIEKASSSFKDMLAKTIEQVTQADRQGDQAIVNFNSGEATDLHEVMLSVEEADIAVRTLVQMRNKALEVYNEVMKMQI